MTIPVSSLLVFFLLELTELSQSTDYYWLTELCYCQIVKVKSPKVKSPKVKSPKVKSPNLQEN